MTCRPASGSTFPIAATTVTCTAKDPANNTATAPFTVMVGDTAAPVLALRITAEAVRNAVQHGAGHRIELWLSADPVCLAVMDDGRASTCIAAGAAASG